MRARQVPAGTQPAGMSRHLRLPVEPRPGAARCSLLRLLPRCRDGRCFDFSRACSRFALPLPALVTCADPTRLPNTGSTRDLVRRASFHAPAPLAPPADHRGGLPTANTGPCLPFEARQEEREKSPSSFLVRRSPQPIVVSVCTHPVAGKSPATHCVSRRAVRYRER